MQSAVLLQQFVCLSVQDSHRMEYFENNFMVIWPEVSALCRPQHYGSSPKGTPRNCYSFI